MKLAAKLVAIVLLAIIATLVIDGFFLVRRDVKMLDEDMRRDARILGRKLRDVVIDVWHSAGEQEALELIEGANEKEHAVKIRWVWLNRDSEEASRPLLEIEKLSAALAGEDVSLRKSSAFEDDVLLTYIPVLIDQGHLGALEVSEPLSPLEDRVRDTVVRVFRLTCLLVLVSGFAVVLLGFRLVGRPLNLLIEKTRRIGAGDLSSSLELKGHDELSELASSLNTMCDDLSATRARVREETEARIVALEQLRHADRLQTVGRLASGIAHELGTPLNVVSGRAGLIEAGNLGTDEINDCASIIKTQAERMTRIIRQVLDFARQHKPEKSRINIRDLIFGTFELLRSQTRKREVFLHLDEEDNSFLIDIDGRQIQQVLTNLILNAIQASPKGGQVSVGYGYRIGKPPAGHEVNQGRCLCVTIKDDGEGIASEDVDHIFEPFFTTKDVGEGSGLGLSIAYGIVQEHGGWIDVSSAPGKGSQFEVFIPVEDEG